MGLEQNLWEWLRNGVKPLIARGDLHICRVENSVGPGYPDVEGCFDSFNFHLELKAYDRPKKTLTPIRVKFQPRQVPWLRKRWSVGGSCWVLLRVGTGRDMRHYLISGDQAHLLKKIPEHEIYKISGIHPKDTGIEIIRSAVRYPNG